MNIVNSIIAPVLCYELPFSDSPHSLPLKNTSNLCACTDARYEDFIPQYLDKSDVYIRNPLNKAFEKISYRSTEKFKLYNLKNKHLVRFLTHGVKLQRVADLLPKFFKIGDNPNQICKKIIKMSPAEALPSFTSTIIASSCKKVMGYASAVCDNLICWGKRNKPKALILRGAHDGYAFGAPEDLEKNPFFYRVLFKAYDICKTVVWDASSLRDRIVEFVKEQGKISFLHFQMHGNIDSAALYKDSYGDYERVNVKTDFGYLQNSLHDDATVFLESCSTGKGRENHGNLANHLANSSPLGVAVVAPVIPSYSKNTEAICSKGKVTVLIADEHLSVDEMTYTLDTSDKEKHCKESQARTNLNFCTQTS